MSELAVRVCCAVVLKGGKVFAARRSKGSNQGMKWEFPGGKLEAGETEEACLHRELEEELKLRVHILKKLPVVVHRYPAFVIQLVPFVCELIEGPMQNIEHETTGWFSAGELQALEWSEADIPVMEYVTGHLM